MAPAGPTVADRVVAARRRAFVGRRAELELFRQAVEAPDEPPFTVLHVHGAGGIGKSALVRAFADLAADAGATVVRVDGPDVAADRAAIRTAVEPAAGSGRRAALLVDGYDVLAPLDAWFREELLPGLPGSVVVVLAGRHPPAAGWTDDPGWRELGRVLPLRPLSPAESARLLAGSRLSDEETAQVLRLAGGHPLVLALARELAGTGDVLDRLTGPDALGRLVPRLIDATPTPRHHRALHLCARARATTEALLREVLADDAAEELFEWLRAQPWIECAPAGLRPHDALREALVRDLEWRDPDTARSLYSAYQSHVVRRIRAARDGALHDALLDAVFDSRHDPATRAYYDWDTFGAVEGGAAGPADRADLDVLLRRHLADADADAVLRWFAAQPDRFSVYRSVGRVRGVVARIVLDTADPTLVAADPVAEAAWSWARERGRRPGEAVTLQRCALDLDAGSGPSPAFNLACELGLRHTLTSPELALDTIATSEPERTGPYCTAIGYPLVRRVEVDGRVVGVHGADWRTAVPEGWWDAIPPPVARAPVPDPAFVDAVRAALRHLTRPTQLAGSPLLAAGVARHPDGLRTALLDAVGTLTRHPRDRKLHRALDRTYVRPAPTQERAAELLGLPFSTYRRHLGGGVDRVAGYLWTRR